MEPTDTEFMRELMTVFCAEAEDRLGTIDQRLLSIEGGGDPAVDGELLADLMRELHTLKGSAGAVNLPEVSRLAHALETHFGRLRAPGASRAEIFDHGYRALDRMREIIGAGARGERIDADVDGLLVELAGPGERLDAVGHAEPVEWVAPSDAPAVDAAPPAGGLAGPSPDAARPAPTIVPAPAVPVPASSTPAPRPAAPAGTPPGDGRRRDGAEEYVRLSTTKLDSLMARVGELVVTRIATGRRTTEVRELADTVAQWEEHWRGVRPQYLRLAAASRGEGGSVAELMPELQRVLAALERGDDRLHEVARQVTQLRSAVEADERRLTQVSGDIEDEVRRTRMLPVATVVDPLHRVVRDLARDLGKEVVLEVEGGETEVDRAVLDHIRGPLTHLVRNAIDHGVEPPDAREAVGKPRRATLRLAAAQRGGSLILAIADDGAGIDVATVRATAVSLGLVGPDQLRVMSDRDILRLVLRPAFTTAGSVTDLSGRGVGLDVVRETAERLNGMVDIASEHGLGTTVTLSLPLSVATTQALLVQVGGLTHAMPIGAISRIVSAERDAIGRAQGRELLVLDDGPVVLVRLEDLLQLPGGDETGTRRRPVIVVGSDERRVAVAVDELLGTQDVVVKALPRPFERVRHVAGATVLASGEVVVVLNTSDLVRSAVRTAGRVEGHLDRLGRTHAPAAAGRAASPDRSGPTGGRGAGAVLVVDDSIVTRMLEKSILEAAGYTVHAAADGVEALRILRGQPVDLVVSDVNMPNLDGLALTHQIRADAALRDLPIILVTSLDAPDDQVRGMEAGADAYIVKSSFSQEGLLETVSRLITASHGRHAVDSRR